MEASADITVSPLVTKVFDLELLREKILEYALFDDNQTGGRARFHVRRSKRTRNACTIRLVSKTWLQSTSRVLLKLNKPLFHFTMRDDCYNTTGRIKEDSGMPLDDFVESVAGNKLLDERVPPFTIYAAECYFKEKNYKRFFDCLTHCGGALVQLDLQLLDKHAFMLLGRNLRLPKLQSLTVRFDTSFHFAGATDLRIDTIQSIFDTSQQLKSFVFISSFHAGYIPDYLSNLVLPSALQHVDLDCTMDDCIVQVLLKNHLPNLKTLKLRISMEPFKNGVITSILETVGKKLENLEAGRAYSPSSTTRRSTTFRLPFMDKLNRLCIDTPCLELEGPFSCLERLVPNLSHMILTRQTAQMFRKWAERSCFESVSSLTVCLLRDHVFEKEKLFESQYDNLIISLDVDTMNILNAAYPNLVELDISFCAAQLQSSGFVAMMQLSKLKLLKIQLIHCDEIQSPDVFDALFLGIPEESVATLRNSPELWEDLPEDKKTTSIRNLIDLETLHLGSPDLDYYSPFILDLLFEFAFLKMPRLTNLELCEPFIACTLMTEKWRNEGRTIELR